MEIIMNMRKIYKKQLTWSRKKQHRLVAELSYELGNFYNENRSYKLSAKYFKISAENKMD